MTPAEFHKWGLSTFVGGTYVISLADGPTSGLGGLCTSSHGGIPTVDFGAPLGRVTLRPGDVVVDIEREAHRLEDLIRAHRIYAKNNPVSAKLADNTRLAEATLERIRRIQEMGQ